MACFLKSKTLAANWAACSALVFAPAAALAKAQGYAEPWQMDFIASASPVKEQLTSFHNMMLVIITVISLFVLALMVYIAVRFNKRANPVPSKTTHNTLLEVLWTGLPVLILVAIAVPSLRLLYFAAEVPEKADMTLKVVAHQWYWSYEYPDHGFGYDSNMKEDKDLSPGEPRLLAVDNRVVVPVDATVRVQITSADVIHNWAMPALGLKTDAVPGRLNETWFKATKTGVFYGQCSELCGVRHGFMPIAVEVMEKPEFDRWVEDAKQKYASSIATGAPAFASAGQ